MLEPRRPISKSDLPSGYAKFLADPDGSIKRWQKRCDLRAEYESLKKQETKVKHAPAAGADLKNNIQIAYQKYRDQLVKNARVYLEKSRGRVDGLQNLYKFAHLYHLDNFVPLDVLLEAADQLASSQEGGIADEDRKTALKQIEADKERIKTELAEVSPPQDFNFNDGAVDGDLIDQFVNHWKNLQGGTRGECDARGIDLKYSSELEKRFYYRLGLDKIIPARSAKFRPFQPGAAK